jgi:hypothetical protein
MSYGLLHPPATRGNMDHTPYYPRFVYPLTLDRFSNPIERYVGDLFAEFKHKGGPIGVSESEIGHLHSQFRAAHAEAHGPRKLVATFASTLFELLRGRGLTPDAAWHECNRILRTEFSVIAWLGVALSSSVPEDVGRLFSYLIGVPQDQYYPCYPVRIDGKRLFPEPDLFFGSESTVVGIELKSRGTGSRHVYDSGQYLQYLELMQGLRVPHEARLPAQNTFHIVVAPGDPLRGVQDPVRWLRKRPGDRAAFVHAPGLRSKTKKWSEVLESKKWSHFIGCAIAECPLWFVSYSDLVEAASGSDVHSGSALREMLSWIESIASDSPPDVRDFM